MFKSLFYEERIAQVAAYLLYQAGGSLEILKLMKLMYLVERRSLEWYGEPITGDTPYSFKDGPVLSTSYDRAKATKPTAEAWSKLVLPRDGNDVALRVAGELPATPKLSRANRKVIDDVWAQFGKMSGSQLRRWTHEHCPEYDDPLLQHVARLPIDRMRLLKGVGYSDDAAAGRLRDLQEQTDLQKALAAHF